MKSLQINLRISQAINLIVLLLSCTHSPPSAVPSIEVEPEQENQITIRAEQKGTPYSATPVLKKGQPKKILILYGDDKKVFYFDSIKNCLDQKGFKFDAYLGFGLAQIALASAFGKGGGNEWLGAKWENLNSPILDHDPSSQEEEWIAKEFDDQRIEDLKGIVFFETEEGSFKNKGMVSEEILQAWRRKKSLKQVQSELSSLPARLRRFGLDEMYLLNLSQQIESNSAYPKISYSFRANLTDPLFGPKVKSEIECDKIKITKPRP